MSKSGITKWFPPSWLSIMADDKYVDTESLEEAAAKAAETSLSKALIEFPNGRGLDEHDRSTCPVCIYVSKQGRFDERYYYNVVPGKGPKPCDIMLIGEAPGQEEAFEKSPFIGPAGQTLTECLNQAFLDRTKVFITNVVPCRPWQNHAPTKKEVQYGVPFLIRQIREVQPKVIVLLGGVALQAVLGKSGITRLRGNIFTSKEFNCKIVPTFHPSYLLRNSDDVALRGKVVKDLAMVKMLAETGTTGTTKKATNYQLVDTVEKLQSMFEVLKNAETIDFDLETTGLEVDKHRIICVAFSVKECEAYAVPIFVNGKEWWGAEKDAVMAGLKAVFESDVPKCAHMGSFDIPFLRAIGITVNNYIYDTLMMHYLLDENSRAHGLKDLALQFTDMGMYDADVEEWKSQLVIEGDDAYAKKTIDFSKIPFDVLWPYAAADTDAAGRLRRMFYPRMEQEGLLPLYKKIVVPLYGVLRDIEWDGVRIDLEKLKALRKECTEIVADLDEQLRSHPITEQAKGYLELDEINYSSPVQLRKILFDLLKLKPVKSTKTGNASTDDDSLTKLAEKHPIPKLIKQKRAYEHLLKAYGENFERYIRKDGRIHSKFLPHGTEIGRLASRNPNLQNIARMEEDAETGLTRIASRIRAIFVSEPGHSFVEADYAQIQYRMWANYAKDPQMVEDIKNGFDVHRWNASRMIDKPMDKITKEERQHYGKGTTYSMMFGASAYKISSVTGVSKERAQRVIEGFFQRYPGAGEYERRMIHMARTKGFVADIFGRRRRLPGILSTDMKIRSHAERNAVNTPIQQLEAEVLYIAMIRLHKALLEDNVSAKLVLPIHDSLLVECADSEISRVVVAMHKHMLKAIPGIDVPIEVEIKTGRALDTMKPLTKDAICAILKGGGNNG